ncbi:MAG: hypothetical protein WCI92_15095 [Bacteroidota bacterium]
MNTLYSVTLFLHSWNRWLILVAGVIVLAAAVKGLSSKSDYSPFQKRWALIFMSSLHLQLLVGIIMYFFLSPYTAQAFSNFGGAMKDSVLRFWAVEHTFVNIVAIGLAQTGSILVKKRKDAAGKNKRTLIWTGIALLLILAMIPMGMMGVERPWFRF